MAKQTNTTTSTTPLTESDGRFAKGSVARNYIIAAIGEFLGTFLFLLIAFTATQAAKNSWANAPSTTPSAFLLLYIAFAFGFSLAVNVFLFYRVSGGLFNPAVSLAFVVLKLMTPVKGVILVIAQLLGGIAAGGVATGLMGKLDVNTTLGPNTSTAQGFFIEVFMTLELTLTIIMLAVEKHRTTHLAPLVIGLSLFVCHLVAISLTGASLNPARSLGSAVVSADFVKEHWIYWIGPAFGALLAAAIYKSLVLLGYQTANPGQDDDGLGWAQWLAEQAALKNGRHQNGDEEAMFGSSS